MPRALIITAQQAPAPLKIVGEEITILADGAQTGSYEIFHQAGPAGSGPPPHSHPWDEAFYVIDGQVEFGVDDTQDVTASAGTFVHVPSGSLHWFRFGAPGGVMISMTSHAGVAAFFTQVDREVSPTDPDLGSLITIASDHGLTIPAPAD